MLKRTEAIRRLVDAMIVSQGKDYTLDDIYLATFDPPHEEIRTSEFLHSRCSRVVARMRKVAAQQGYRIVVGQGYGSYRAIKLRA